jgi:hypothetical protein
MAFRINYAISEAFSGFKRLSVREKAVYSIGLNGLSS